jgi:hypothetical protein
LALAVVLAGPVYAAKHGGPGMMDGGMMMDAAQQKQMDEMRKQMDDMMKSPATAPKKK